MNYFIIQNEETKGPYTIGQLRSLWNSGAITSQTLYCQEGFSEWLPLSRIIRDLEPPPAMPVPPTSSPAQPSIVMVKPTKSRGVYIILGILLGSLGIHNFYAGHYGRGSAQLFISLLIGGGVAHLISLGAESTGYADASDIFVRDNLPGFLKMGCIALAVWILSDLLTVTDDSEGREMA